MGIDVYSLKNSYLFFKNYIYFLIDKSSKSAALIDPVWEKKKLFQFMADYEITLSCILLTHSHPDHVQLAGEFAQMTGCPVYISRVEADFYGFTCSNLVPLLNREIIQLGETSIMPILTPGHTKGSFCYIADDNIFTGDTLFIEGCGLCWGKGADPAEMFDTLQLLKRIIPPETRVYPAHRYGVEPGICFKEVMKYNIYLDFKKKEDFIKYRMRKKQKLLFAFK